MRLSPTLLQQEIADSAAALFRRRFDPATLRELACDPSTAIDEGRWSEVAAMGWLGLLAPEAAGGLGLGAADGVMLFREVGRSLVPGPLLWTALAADVAAEAGENDLAQALMTGERRAGLACSGFALDGRPGDLLLTLAPDGSRLDLMTSCEAAPALDPTSRVARIGSLEPLAVWEHGDRRALARILAAAELLGIIEAARDMSAAYAISREQFGKPIGSFQAVKHRCADMAIAALAVRAQVFMAAHRHDLCGEDADFHAACALTLAIDGATRTTADNIQNHGAIGFTAEHDAQLLVKRVITLEHALGPKRAIMADVLAPEAHVFH
jgi:alkylation response protein AidB-like acyl-CoA dehydrogenase